MDDLARLLLSHLRIEAQVPVDGDITRVMFKLDLEALREEARDENRDVPGSTPSWQWRSARKAA